MLTSVDFQIPAVQSEAEAGAIVERLRGTQGVTFVRGDHRTKLFVATWTAPATWDALKDTLMRMGYVPKYR